MSAPDPTTPTQHEGPSVAASPDVVEPYVVPDDTGSQYNPDGPNPGETIEFQQAELTRIVSNASSQHDGGVLGKLQILGHKLKERKNKDEILKVGTEDFDFQRILKSYLTSASEQGIHLRSTGVTFQNVTTTGVDAASSYVDTSKDMLLAPVMLYKSYKEWRAKKQRKIIQNVTGVVKPGEMCLVLGRPGAGCSSLLKTIAGEQDQFTGVEGDINYDGIPQDEMMKKYKGDVIYNGELEFHYPHLTVDQTLRFAIGCKTPHTRVYNVSRENFVTAERDLLGTIFGLTHTFDTKVGNDYIRGVSGGERKRVSIAEAMACKASVYCWDNATRGLDASTALEYAQAIRTSTSLTRSVAFVTIYQAGEKIFEAFDKVLILAEGRQIFFGEAERAKQYFIDMGFECPSRQATAEFLTAVTDPKGRTARPGFENKVPRTNEEFEAYWMRSPEHQQLMDEIESYKESKNADNTRDIYDKSLKQANMRSYSRYTVSYLYQLKLLTIRGFQRIIGDLAYTVIECVASLFQALILGSLYWDTPNSVSGAFSRGGLLFFALLYFSLMGLSEIAGQFAERPILLKQKSYSLFHPSAETLASLVSKFPFKLLSILFFYIPYYFLSNLNRQASKFFLNLLFLIVSTQAIGSLFEMIASVSASFPGANAVAGVCVLILVVYNGYMVQLREMHPWFKWLSYINPVRYAYESMMAVEFHGREMDCTSKIVPQGGAYDSVSIDYKVCAFVGSVPGQSWVSGDRYIELQYSYHYSHIWRNFGILIAFFVFFLAVTALATEFKRPVSGGGDHLYYKKSKEVPEGVFLSKDHKHEDLESGEQDTTNKEEDSNAATSDEHVFDGLGSTGVFMWKNVDYVIPTGKTTRKLLDNVQGYVKPGTLTALMGESGAGKTTLLNVLSQRIDFGTITGDFLVNGKPLDSSFQRSTGYVQQQDLHIAEMTVREALRFAARLRRAQTVPESEKLEYVEQIIKILGMDSYAEAIIGDIGSGLNVEQRKKLSIGVELVAKPSLLLFLDEPTSGLDSQSAWAIVQLLRKLAGAGQSILCTIHQPSATLFESFDNLLLLKKGGRTVYFGPIGVNSRVILDYFERNGARKCETVENPAEYILEAIGAGATASVQQDWGDVWNSSPEYTQTAQTVDELITQNYTNEDVVDPELHKKFAMPYRSQLYYVIKRTATQFYRDPKYIRSKMILFIVGGLVIGFTFWDLKDTLTGLQNSVFTVFMALIITAAAMNQLQSRAINSRELFEVRESKSNTFHWSALLFAQFINELPYQIFLGSIFFCCVYFPLKEFTEASRAGVFYLVWVLVFQFYYISLALVIVYMSPDLPSASVIGGLILSFLISFCGVVQPVSLMPGFWTFMYKVSPFTYFVQTLAAILIHDKPVVCTPIELNYFKPPPGFTCEQYAGPFAKVAPGYISVVGDGSECAYCPYNVGDEFLSTVGIKYSYIWRNFGFYWVYIVFNLVAMCALFYLFRMSNYVPFQYTRKAGQYVKIACGKFIRRYNHGNLQHGIEN